MNEMDTSGVTSEAIMQHEIEKIEEQQKNVIEKYKRQLKDCVNELCYRCGDYKEEHLGRCNGCKWRVIRNGDT
jgi:hypothetical protein